MNDLIIFGGICFVVSVLVFMLFVFFKFALVSDKLMILEHRMDEKVGLTFFDMVKQTTSENTAKIDAMANHLDIEFKKQKPLWVVEDK